MAIIGATELQPVNLLGSYMQGMELGRANQLARQEQAAKMRDMQRKQQLNALLSSGVNIDDPRTQMDILALGGGAELKTLSDLRGNQLSQSKTRAEIEKMERERKKIAFDEAMNFIAVHDNPQDYPLGYARVVELLGQDEVAKLGLTPEYTPQVAARLKTIGQSLLDEKARIEAEDRAETRKLGAENLAVAQANVGLRGAELKFQRDKTQREINQERSVVARTETDEAGNVRSYNKFGDLIKTEKGAGKPSAEFAAGRTKKAETARQLTEVIGSLTNAMKPGGLIEQSTGSGAGRLTDITAGFFGYGTPGAVAAAKLAPIADQVLKLVPRFEGPQSDKDTQSYKEAAGMLADPWQPNNIRMEAAKTILEIYKKRRDQFVTSGTPETSADIDALLKKYE